MKLIVGLGNVGDRYEGTRHNVGFVGVDRLARDGWKEESKFKAFICRQGEVILAKPTTYMNGSGEAVGKLINFYKLDLDDLCVIHDDLDLEIGLYRVQKGVGPKVHNGVNSVEVALGSKDFWRLRIGVDGRNGDRSMSGEDYVLGKFLAEEREIIKKTIDGGVVELIEKLGL